MVGSELALMIDRITISLGELQILPGYHSFSKVSESCVEIFKVLDKKSRTVFGPAFSV
jgi:hypothetical protein